MARGAMAGLTTGTSSATPAWELRASAAANGLRVLQIGISLAAATASVFGFGRPAAIGITPTTPKLLLANNNQDTLAAETALAWGTAPTQPANYFREISLAAAIGNGIVWTWSENAPLYIPAGGSLVIWNVQANSAFYYWVEADE